MYPMQWWPQWKLFSKVFLSAPQSPISDWELSKKSLETEKTIILSIYCKNADFSRKIAKFQQGLRVQIYTRCSLKFSSKVVINIIKIVQRSLLECTTEPNFHFVRQNKLSAYFKFLFSLNLDILARLDFGVLYYAGDWKSNQRQHCWLKNNIFAKSAFQMKLLLQDRTILTKHSKGNQKGKTTI